VWPEPGLSIWGAIAFALKIHEKLIFRSAFPLYILFFVFDFVLGLWLLQLNKNYLHALAI